MVKKLFTIAVEKNNTKPTTQPKRSNQKDIDIKNYTIHFESIFSNLKMFQAFYNHLKFETNPEPLEFLIDYDKLEIITNSEIEKQQVELVKTIIKKYIESSAEKALNISGETKSKLLDSIKIQLGEEHWKLLLQPPQYFEKLKEIIITELRLDVYPRFIRGTYCEEAVLLNKGDNSVISLTAVVNFPYKNEDFIQTYVTDRDFNFMKSLSQDTFDWELVGSLTSQLNSFFFR